MAEVVREGTKSALGRSLRSAGSKESYHRQYNALNKDKNAEYNLLNSASRANYYQQYNRLYKDKLASYRAGNGEWRVDYNRRYHLENNDQSAEYRLRNDDARAAYHRRYNDLYNARNKERVAANLFLSDASRAEYHRRYYLEAVQAARWRGEASESKSEFSRQRYLESKESKGEFHVRNDGLKREYRQRYSRGKTEFSRLYFDAYRRQNSLAKKEQTRVYFGSQRANHSWRTPDAVRDYFESIASRLNISNFADWQRISRNQLDQHGGLTLYKKFGNLGAAMQYAFPEIQWATDASSPARGARKKSVQRWLRLKIEEVLPGIEIIEDYQHPELQRVDSDRNVELDLWLPEHRIGVEYQGEQHYYNLNHAFGPSGASVYSERDAVKNALCELRNVTLISIPYWYGVSLMFTLLTARWDGSVESLSATLYQARPDVFPVSHGSPIPREMPLIHQPKCLRAEVRFRLIESNMQHRLTLRVRMPPISRNALNRRSDQNFVNLSMIDIPVKMLINE